MSEIEKLYELYFMDIFLYVMTLTKDENLSQDIVSETFLKAIKGIDSFNGTCDVRVWLCQIAKNCYFSYLKKNKRYTQINNFKEESYTQDIVKKVTDEIKVKKINKIIEVMKDPHKKVFVMRFNSDLSFKKIGELFNKSENWACVTYHRAVNKIAMEMEKDNENNL